MDQKTKAQFKAKANIVKAMAHPSRLFIVNELSKKERCVCDLKDLIGADMSTVSKHLSILKSVGIIQDEKRGSMVFYKLKLSCVLDFFGCVETVMKSAAKRHAELVK